MKRILDFVPMNFVLMLSAYTLGVVSGGLAMLVKEKPHIESIGNIRVMIATNAIIKFEVVWYDGFWATSGYTSVLVFSNGVGRTQGEHMEYDHQSK